jgi:hypothetical protein
LTDITRVDSKLPRHNPPMKVARTTPTDTADDPITNSKS